MRPKSRWQFMRKIALAKQATDNECNALADRVQYSAGLCVYVYDHLN